MDEKFKKAIVEHTKIKRDIMKSMADIARQLYKLSKTRDSVKSAICKATTFLEENEDNDDMDLETEYDILKVFQDVKELQAEELKMEMKLTEFRTMRYDMIEMLKKNEAMVMEIKRQSKRQTSDIMKRDTHIMKLERRIAELKREGTQLHIMQEYESDLLLKVAEDECIEILKSRLNVD